MLAYYHLSSASPNTAEALAWNGMHALEASAAVTRTNLSRSELAALWTRDDLAEYCTDSLIPAEGGIQRLHAGVYRQGLKNYSVKKPAITDEQIEILFKRLIPFLHRPEVLRMIVWMIGHEDSSWTG
ncbi:hypothetical protein OSTOST_19577 [Ostertagia ostertagi]